jgi:hypothetical protein
MTQSAAGLQAGQYPGRRCLHAGGNQVPTAVKCNFAKNIPSIATDFALYNIN